MEPFSVVQSVLPVSGGAGLGALLRMSHAAVFGDAALYAFLRSAYDQLGALCGGRKSAWLSNPFDGTIDICIPEAHDYATQTMAALGFHWFLLAHGYEEQDVWESSDDSVRYKKADAPDVVVSCIDGTVPEFVQGLPLSILQAMYTGYALIHFDADNAIHGVTTVNVGASVEAVNACLDRGFELAHA